MRRQRCILAPHLRHHRWRARFTDLTIRHRRLNVADRGKEAAHLGQDMIGLGRSEHNGLALVGSRELRQASNTKTASGRTTIRSPAIRLMLFVLRMAARPGHEDCPAQVARLEPGRLVGRIEFGQLGLHFRGNLRTVAGGAWLLLHRDRAHEVRSRTTAGLPSAVSGAAANCSNRSRRSFDAGFPSAIAADHLALPVLRSPLPGLARNIPISLPPQIWPASILLLRISCKFPPALRITRNSK